MINLDVNIILMRHLFYILSISIIGTFSCQQKVAEEEKELTDAEIYQLADSLAHKFIIVDGHVDIPYRLWNHPEDISVRTENGHFDYVRAKEGGLDAPIMSIYIPPAREDNGAKMLADSLINLVENLAKEHPDKFAIATSPTQIKEQFLKGLISLPMGMENGAPIEHKLENIEYFHDRGIRYITLTHAKANHISDSSYDSIRLWNGLSPFGEEVVAEMNRVGIMVDVSHVSDSAFYDVLAVTKVPVIASHSSCRHFTPGMERNMSDNMIKALAKNGGVIHINFGSFFLDPAFAKEERDTTYFAKASQIADNVDRVVELAGIDYVAFGSDFDGIGDLPEDVKDASQLPNVLYELLKRGYSAEDIEKICSKNTFRVWQQVEDYAVAQN
ncbi:Zn-dependent dipeptidase-like protein [hydrothermal vent metagenome]|uniref:Zn-dependent dipeptidase-like protein n=1 Tax=hydrothermal vent metagenome TaxID=652676 RepID=A0A3B0V5W9_9ZZZZ